MYSQSTSLDPSHRDLHDPHPSFPCTRSLNPPTSRPDIPRKDRDPKEQEVDGCRCVPFLGPGLSQLLA